MATQTLRQIRIAGSMDGGSPAIKKFPDASTQSFQKGQLVYLASGKVTAVATDGTTVLGIANQAASTTEDTAIALKESGIYAVKLYKIHEYGLEPNIMGCLQNGAIDLVINIPLPTTVEEKFRTIMDDEYKIRRMAVDYNLPVIINLELAEALIDAIANVRRKEKSIKSLNEYHQTLKEVYW